MHAQETMAPGEVSNKIVMHFLLSLVSNLNFKPSFVSIYIEGNSGSVYYFKTLSGGPNINTNENVTLTAAI